MTKIIKKSVGFIMSNSNVVKGTVKWFNETKGFLKVNKLNSASLKVKKDQTQLTLLRSK